VNISYTYGNALAAPKPLTVVKVKHGVTEASLSDGRIIRLSLHIEGVTLNGDKLDIAYQVITEVMQEPELPILDVHEGIQ
jgi:hypothetical protein